MSTQLQLFTAPAWCSQCRLIDPKVRALARRNSIPLDVVDIDQRPDLAAQLGVMSVPTLLGWIGDRPVDMRPPTLPRLRELERQIEEARA
jgi:thioredoxin 1